MKIGLLPYAIRYYAPWIFATKRKLESLVTIGEKQSQKAQESPKALKANAQYCYSVWLRHLSILNEHGLNTNPGVVAELGPGDSIGVGLMALLTGSKKYYALDIVKRANLQQSAKLLDDLVALLSNRSDIPDKEEFPKLHPRLDSYTFPLKIITEQRMGSQLNNERIKHIKEDLLHNENINNGSSSVQYICPWNETSVIRKESVDMIFSQAVLEHVIDLQDTYEAMCLWLKKGGAMSHQIDFKSHLHGPSDEWNSHWSHSDFEWKLIKGKKSYEINREPLSTHIELLNKTGFKIISVIPVKEYPSDKYSGSIRRNQLAERFRDMSEEDFNTCNAYILSMKE